MPPGNFLGTLDDNPLELKVNSLRALRLEPDSISPNIIGGSDANFVLGAFGATIAGGGFAGGPNAVTANFGTIGGGNGNNAMDVGATVGGGFFNAASGTSSTVAGGDSNLAIGTSSSVGGGVNNNANGLTSSVAGGNGNNAGGNNSNVAGGTGNSANGDDSNVAGGSGNSADGIGSSVAGGHGNTAGGTHSSVSAGAFNIASGDNSIAVGGNFNSAVGDYSFAAGHMADAAHTGTFVWADSTPALFSSNNHDEFAVRATGGVRFQSGPSPSMGVYLAPNSGGWSMLSDRAMKRDFAAVDGNWLLGQIAAMPISSWRYKAQKSSIRHLGPTAQDFTRAFGLGESNKRINSIDSEGVSLAGIKALDKLVRAQSRQLRAQQRELDVLKAQVANLQRGRSTTSR
jgi:hypothetical protein